jgi:hypothetical protein
MAGAMSPSEAPRLLHNIGSGGPQAHLTWRGFNSVRSTPSASIEQRLGHAATRGTWIKVSYRHAYYMATGCAYDWSKAQSLLHLVWPSHELTEAASRSALVEMIEAQCEKLDWPEFLVAADDDDWQHPRDMLKLDHALIAFVARSKSTGNLWVRRRAIRMAALHAPSNGFIIGKGLQDRQAFWQTRLWFPGGIPVNLLASIRKTSQGE